MLVGADSFDRNVAEKAIELGFKPDCISSNLHDKSIKFLCHSLALTMSKFLSLGLSLDEVICSVTHKPAQIIGIDSFENGIIGKKARFTVFSLENCVTDVDDTAGNRWKIDSVIKPKYTVIGNNLIEAVTGVDRNEREDQ